MRDMVTITFEGSITLPVEELDAVLGDAVQAVQSAIGHTGIAVVSADTSHVDDGDDLSFDALAERELAEERERWTDDGGSW